MSSQSVETTYNSGFRLSPWIQFLLGFMSIMCCLSFSMLPLLSSIELAHRKLQEAVRKEPDSSHVLCISVMTFLSVTGAQWQNGLPCHLMSLIIFWVLSPLHWQIFVFLSCCKIFLRDRTLPYTANNPAILLIWYNSVKQSAKQGCEQCYLNLPPER